MSVSHEELNIESLVRLHVEAAQHSDSPRQADRIFDRLARELEVQGVSSRYIAAIVTPLRDAHAALLKARRALSEQQAEARSMMDKVYSSSARKLGRVTRVTTTLVDGETRPAVWIDDRDFVVLPREVETQPVVGDLAEYTLGLAEDAIWFGSHRDVSNTMRCRFRSVDIQPDGNLLVEVSLHEQGEQSDCIWARVSEELAEILPELKPGDPLRVTREPACAFPVPPEADEERDETRGGLFEFITPVPAEKDDFTYDARVLQRIDSAVGIIARSEKALRNRIKVPKVICFSGPSGCGKSTIARRYLARLMEDLDFQIIAINSAQIRSSWLGESEKRFDMALKAGDSGRNTLILMDEADSVLPKRSGHNMTTTDDVNARTFATAVQHLDREQQPGDPLRVVVFTTNFFSNLDAALRRRVDEHIQVGLPGRDTSLRIMTGYLSNRPDVVQTDPADLARQVIAATDFPFMRLVFDGSEDVEEYLASQLLTGAIIEAAVQTCARLALTTDGVIRPAALAAEVNRRLEASYADCGPEDLPVAIGMDRQQARRIKEMHVMREQEHAVQSHSRVRRLQFLAAS